MTWLCLLTVVPYKVLIYPSPKFGCSTTSANPWISFAGQQGETGVIDIPKGCLEFNVEVCSHVLSHIQMYRAKVKVYLYIWAECAVWRDICLICSIGNNFNSLTIIIDNLNCCLISLMMIFVLICLLWLFSNYSKKKLILP